MTAMRKAFEAHFHTPEQVAEYVAQAVAISTVPVVPEELREAAFVQALQLLAQKQVTFEQVSPAGVLMQPNGMR